MTTSTASQCRRNQHLIFTGSPYDEGCREPVLNLPKSHQVEPIELQLRTPRLGSSEIDADASVIRFGARHCSVSGESTAPSPCEAAESTSPIPLHDQGTTRLDRTEFGITADRGFAGRYLDLTLDIHRRRTA
jgi:hypothetical protein